MRAPRLARALLLAVGLTTTVPALATPPELERARKQLDELKYDVARASLAAALASGQARLDELVEVHRLSGEVAATLGDAVEAQAAFERALSLKPDTTLPEGVSPKIAEPFEAARRKLAARKLAAIATLDHKSGKLVVEIKDDPTSLVGGARAFLLTEDGQEQRLEAKGTGKLVLDAPTKPGQRARVEIVDASGNVLAEIDADESGGALAGQSQAALVEPATADAGPSTPIYRKWWLWAGIGGAAAVVGTAFALSSQSAEDDLAQLNQDVRDMPFSHDYAEAKALEDKARSRALSANLAFLVAGGCAVTAVVFWMKGRDAAPAKDAPTASLTPLPGGGAALGFGATF